MDLVFDTPEFSQTGNNLLELELNFRKFGLVKVLDVVQHLSLGVTH
jgi:hypothetical protein